MSREDGRSAADKARELDRIGREAMRDGRSEGGLSEDDLRKLEQNAQKEDYARINREAFQRERQVPGQESAPPPTGSILDGIDTTSSSRGVMGFEPNRSTPRTEDSTERGLRETDLRDLEREEHRRDLTGLLNALKKPENLFRLGGAGLGVIGLILLALAFLRADANRPPGAAVASPTPAAATAAPTVTTAPTPIPTAALPATPISAGPVVATQTGTVTAYSVEDVQGTTLRYEWRNSATCGTQTGQGTAAYSWDHPHVAGVPNSCPEEPFHGSFISVQITDPSNRAVVRQWAGGSRPGRGAVPAGGGAFAVQTSPTPARTTAPATTAAATATSTAAAATTGPTVTAGGVNYPLAGLGLVFLIGALGLFFGGPRLAGGPVIAEPKKDEDPCAKEKARLAAAQAAAAAAEARLRELDALAESVQSTQRDAAAKDQAVTAATAGASSYVNNAKQTVYTNPQQRARIEAAQADAAAAHAAAAAAQSAFNAAGGAGARRSAADSIFTTNRELRDAQAALDACLHIVSLATPTPTPGPTGGGGGTTTTGGTGVKIGTGTGTGDGTRTRERRECDPDGAERARPGTQVTTESVWIPNLRGAQLKFQSDMRAETDFPIDDFLDWAQFTKDSFFEGKKIAGLSEGLGPDGEFPVGGALDLVEFPDFLTYYDEMIDLALKALKEAAEQQALIAKNGDYWLKYSSERYELRCEPSQRCEDGHWVDIVKSSFARTGETRDHETRRIDVHADPSAIDRAVQDAINRSFNQIEAAKTTAENQARRFSEGCR